MKKYSIIDFKNGHVVTAIVPFSWINTVSRTCYWPDRRVHSKAVIDCIVPEKTWSVFPLVGVKYESDDYRKVAEKFKLLMDGTSDVASTSESEECLQQRRHLAPKTRHWSSSDSDDETLYASITEREACSEELQLPVREAASNATSRESREPCFEDLRFPMREVDRALQRIFKILEEMKKEQQEMKMEQQEMKQLLLSRSDDNQHIGGGAPNDFSFPLKTEKDLQRLEEDLEDHDIKKKMVKYFSCIGGDSVATLVRSMLRRIFSTPLALQYNFTGAKGKKGYNTLRVRGVMMTAVWKTFPQATEVEMNAVARKWFICARDRDGGRHRRIKPTTDSGSSSRLSGGAQ